VKRSHKHHSRKNSKRANRAFAAFFQQYATIERAANAQISVVPPAPDDVSLVQVWLRARGELVDLESQFFTGGAKPKRGLKGLGQLFALTFELIGRQEVTDLVRDFGFQYCNQSVGEIQFIG
jgi:hypothetical protein